MISLTYSGRMNPFEVTTMTPSERGFYGSAQRVRSSFLYRVIQIGPPFGIELVYDGWWFRQRVLVDGVQVSWRISWLTIQRQVEFPIPSATDPNQATGRIEIDFTRGLMIRRFRVWIGETLAYDEIN